MHIYIYIFNLLKRNDELMMFEVVVQVAPAELEAILLSHPAVEDAAVVGYVRR